MEAGKLQSKSTKRTKKKISAVVNKSKSRLNEKDRGANVAVSAYYKAQARGFEPGSELADWLAAEVEVKQ